MRHLLKPSMFADIVGMKYATMISATKIGGLPWVLSSRPDGKFRLYRYSRTYPTAIVRELVDQGVAGWVNATSLVTIAWGHLMPILNEAQLFTLPSGEPDSFSGFGAATLVLADGRQQPFPVFGTPTRDGAGANVELRILVNGDVVRLDVALLRMGASVQRVALVNLHGVLARLQRKFAEHGLDLDEAPADPRDTIPARYGATDGDDLPAGVSEEIVPVPVMAQFFVDDPDADSDA